MLFSVLWGVVDFVGRTLFPALLDTPLTIRLVVFVVLELVLQGLLRWSPGYEFLGISALPAELASIPLEADTKYVLVADTEIVEQESWLTVVLGILFLNDGAKGLVRWSMWNPPVPIMGFASDPIVSAVASALVGIVEIYVAICFLKLRHRAIWIGLAVTSLTLVSTILSWPLWDSFVAEMTERRRAYQGLRVRSGEFEFMQSIIPEGFVVWSVILMFAILFAWRQFSKVKSEQGLG